MTFVPKKKSDTRSSAANNSNATTTTSANLNSGSNKPGAGVVSTLVSKEANQQDLDEQHYPEQEQQHRRSPHVQCPSSGSGGDRMGQEEINYSSYDGEEHNHDRRHSQHHHQHHQSHHHHHHNNHHQHHSKYMNPKSDTENNINHVILITVINPHYPIVCDLIHQICSNYGKVNRIVIFKKNGVQAMVEFDNVESAKRAKAMLHGCDIYSGCCTLKIEFAKPSRLNVHRNDSESFDYTNPNLTTGPSSIQANSDSVPDDNNHQPNHHHHQQHHHHHQLQPVSSASHHSPYHGMNSHHARGSNIGGRRAGTLGGVSGDIMNSSHSTIGGHNHHQHANQFHPSHHMHQSPGNHHQHPRQSLSTHSLGNQHQQQGGPHQPPGYVLNQSVDDVNASDVAETTFHQQHHQDGGSFGAPRGGLASNANVAPTNIHQISFIGGTDTFIPTSSAQQTSTHHNPNPIHNSMYQQRQDGGHHHNQSHHQVRGRLAGNNPGRNHGHHNSSFPPINSINALVTGAGSSHQGTVLMVYGLSVDRINCDRLFNLFCLYGNVVRIKFLRTKEGCAMVQMGDVLAVERCFSSLNKTILFGSELQLSYSKQAFLHDVMQPFTLPDGSPSFKDFMGNKNNRFRNPEVASKNRILPPSRVLHFFNAPFGISEDELVALFKQTTDCEPTSLKIFSPRVDNAKSFSGLVTFRDPAEATEALVLCNHLSIPKAGAPHPYILRLCFSPPTYS